MRPTASNINNNTSVVTSSNNVQWQGGDLPVINLCKGDTISDVVQKAASVLVDIKEQLDLSDLDLKCIFDQCATCPNPSKTLQTVLTLLISKVCELEDLIGDGGGPSGTEPNVILANCFRYTDNDGDTVTQLLHSDYTKRIGIQVCTILTTLNSHTNIMDDHEIRITDLEGKIVPPALPTVSIKCVAPGSSPSNPVVKTIDTAFQLLETQYCTLSTVLGDTTTLNLAVSTEPKPTGNATSVYSVIDSTLSLWNTPAATVGQLLQHFDLAISDLRGAVHTILDSCCKVTCDDIVVDFDSKLSDDRLTLTLFFITKSNVPTGYTDCDTTFGNKLHVTDALGNEAVFFVKVATEINNPTGLVIDLAATPIDPSQDYMISMNACLTNGTTNCVKCVNKTLTYKDTCAYCEIRASGKQSANAKATIQYMDGDNMFFLSVLPGETKVLKKSVRITSLMTFGNISLSGTCQLPEPTPAECYVIKTLTANPAQSNTNILEGVTAVGMYLGGTLYPFTQGFTVNDGATALCTELKTISPFKDILFTPCSRSAQNGNRGTATFYSFMTTPAIGDSMVLKCQAGGGIDNFGDGRTELFYPARSLTYLNNNSGNDNTSNDTTQFCGCNTSTGTNA
jgi:hypothetical protein